jgi:hypothetical protein
MNKGGMKHEGKPTIDLKGNGRAAMGERSIDNLHYRPLWNRQSHEITGPECHRSYQAPLYAIIQGMDKGPGGENLTQHLGAQKLDHLKNCPICRERIHLASAGHKGAAAVRIEKSKRPKEEVRP